VCVSVYLPLSLLGNGSVKNPVVTRQRIDKNPPIVTRQRLGSVKKNPIVGRQRLDKNPRIVPMQRFGSVKIPLSLLGNGGRFQCGPCMKENRRLVVTRIFCLRYSNLLFSQVITKLHRYRQNSRRWHSRSSVYISFLLYVLRYCQYPDSVSSDDRMIAELKRIWKEIVVA
jgi:hypothetical protein